jgi:hypothetical protein
MVPTHHARFRAPADRRPPPGFTPSPAFSPSSVVPFDQAARFELTGTPGNVLQDVIAVSAEGLFVAVAIGYGLEEEPGRSMPLARLDQQGGVVPGDITLGELPASALIDGFRFSPAFERIVFRPDLNAGAGARGALLDPELSEETIDRERALGNGNGSGRSLFDRLIAPREFSFLFSVTDSGTGRELQDEPIHNLASLGASNGERPFRLLAQPITFMPRSTVRLQVTERSEQVRGTLFIVFHGYKVLAAACPEPVMRRLQGPDACPVETIGRPNQRVIPFDYVTTFRLIGPRGRVVEDEVTINAEAGFVATAIGYGLEADAPRVRIEWENTADIQVAAVRNVVDPMRNARDAWDALAPGAAGKANVPTVDLGALPIRLLPTSALAGGVRLRPEYIRLSMTDAGALTKACPVSLLDELFERFNVPERVSFRYSITETGRGVDLQNQPIHNIAGLGVADGTRPFKKLLRPLLCLPRSSLRVRVEERVGRGTLFIVFQGYKLLGDAGRGGRT